jgi:serine/threonine protein kinase/CHASE2 domain-containing sensor protein
MKNKKGLLLDAGVGLLLLLLVSFSYWRQEPFLASIEFKAYDVRAKVLRTTLESPKEIVLVGIDDDAISQVGRWPWPRTRLAAMLDRISADKPRVIGLNILFSEPEQNQGLGEIKRLEDRYRELIAGRKIVQKGADFGVEFASAAVALDSDSKMLASIQSAGNVVMPLFFVDNPSGSAQPPVSAEISSGAVRAPDSIPEGAVPTESKMIPPLAAFAGAAAGFGHVNLYKESDGVERRDAPLIEYEKTLYPSFALRLAMKYHNLKPDDLKFVPDVEVSAGKIRIPVDQSGQTAITFLAAPSADIIKHVTYQTLMSGSLGANYFQDKIVLVGLTATGVGNNFVTPVAADVSSMEIVANSLENILHNRFLTRPPWTAQLEWGLIAAIGLFIMLVLPRLRAFWGLVVSLLFSVLIVLAGSYFFIVGQWIKIGYPLFLLLAGYLIVISKSFLVTEKGKELVEASAIETNKMLGLSFQGQGMLDLAFEKFRLCPLDDNMKDTLYNLALDFERKRQYSKAASVLDHIAAKDPKYKDAAEKGKKLKEASDGAVFGGVGAKKEGTVMLTGGATKPTLGRYEIEKELGRGAMGVVYLGRDPKINRMVAIKTMMLEEGSDGANMKEVKERFFREAESAGTLNHPNIVRIFDAGEENEVAYIAMELLDGQDLTKFCAKGALLPLDKAVEYVAKVADALDYAHAQGIVHRDIKPANIMLLKDGSVRVADFGIARITASSKTATGTVMGTPSYMSPEQVAGRKVDGRSDLFSLTIALFELVTGEKPFKGGEGIGTLLFQIANDPAPDPLSINPSLPRSLKAVIEKGLAKNPDERYQRGSELAAALRAALAAPSGAPAAAAAPAPAPERTSPTAPLPLPPSEPAPAPASEPSKPPKAAKTGLSAADIPGFKELLESRTRPPVEPADETIPVPAPAPAAKTPAADATVRIGPEIPIPGLNDGPPPAAVPAERTMGIELPQRSGVGGAPDASLPPPPPRDPDATVRLTPQPKEPS